MCCQQEYQQWHSIPHADDLSCSGLSSRMEKMVGIPVLLSKGTCLFVYDMCRIPQCRNRMMSELSPRDHTSQHGHQPQTRSISAYHAQAMLLLLLLVSQRLYGHSAHASAQDSRLDKPRSGCKKVGQTWHRYSAPLTAAGD
jgi:hypothetical protein